MDCLNRCGHSLFRRQQNRTRISLDESEFLSRFVLKILFNYDVHKGEWTPFTNLAAGSVFLDLFRQHARLRLVVLYDGHEHVFPSYDKLTRELADLWKVPRPNPRARTARKAKEWIAAHGGQIEFRLEQWIQTEGPLKEDDLPQAGSSDASSVWAQLQKLPEDERIVLEMIFQEGLSQEEVAARTGRSINQVRSASERALARLKILGAGRPKDNK